MISYTLGVIFFEEGARWRLYFYNTMITTVKKRECEIPYVVKFKFTLKYYQLCAPVSL